MRWQPDKLVTTHESVTGHDQLPRQPRRRDDDLCSCAEREQGHYSRSHRRGDHVEGRPRLQVHCAGHCRQYTSWQLCRCDDPVRVRTLTLSSSSRPLIALSGSSNCCHQRLARSMCLCARPGTPLGVDPQKVPRQSGVTIRLSRGLSPDFIGY